MNHNGHTRLKGPALRWRDGYAVGWQGAPIHYTVCGSGEPTLACCNGLGVSTFFWKYVLEHFAETHRIITWDYRGHYRSPSPRRVAPETLTVAANARDLAAVLDAAGVSRAVVLGHSMGVQVLLEFWKRYPERVGGLIPICGPYGRPLDALLGSPRIAHALFDLLYTAIRWSPGLVELWLRPLFRSRIPFEVARLGMINFQLARFEDMRLYFEHLSRLDLRVFFFMAAEMQRHDTGPWLHTVNVPTLIVGGESDLLTPLPLAVEMRDKIPGAELLVLPKGSHAGLIEHPELLNLRIEKFLRERVTPFLASHAVVNRERAAGAFRSSTGRRRAARRVHVVGRP